MSEDDDMGCIPHEPTVASRDLVKLHATVGTPQEMIADLLEIDPKTLRKHYRVELDHSMALANAVVGGQLFKKAKDGDIAAIIFWMKVRAGWRTTQALELSGPNGGPVHQITQALSPTEAAALYEATLHNREG